MFFDRTGSQRTKTTSARTDRSRPLPLHKRMAVIGLAATTAMPMGLTPMAFAGPNIVPPRAEESSGADAMRLPVLMLQAAGNAEQSALTQATEQYNAGQYDEAQQSLQKVDAGTLGDADRKTLDEVSGKIQAAANQRKSARAEYDQGDQAMKENKPEQALVHFKAAAANKFADDGTVQKANEQVVLAQASMKSAESDNKALYKRASDDFDAGRMTEAQEKFQTLQDANYKAGMFQKAPGEYLKEIDKKVAALDADKTQAQARPFYRQAVDQYKSGDWIAARENFNKSKDAGFRAGAFERSPDEYLATMDKKEKSDAAKAQAMAADAEKNKARDAYRAAREEYRKGDWNAARRNFEAANQLGYKPGLFEGDAPSVYLARMDKKEQADAAKAKQQARVDQPADAAPAPGAPAEATEGATTDTTGPATDQAMTAESSVPVTGTSAVEAELQRTAQLERIRQQQRVYESQGMAEKAAESRKEGRVDDALRMFTESLDLDPTNQQALAGRNELLALSGRAAVPTNALEQQKRLIEARRGAIRYSFNTAIGNASQAIGASDFSRAQNEIRAAEVAVNTDPAIFTPAEIAQFNAEIASTRASLAKSQDDTAAVARDEAIRNARKAEEERLRRESAERDRTVADLVKTSRRLINETLYREAIGVIDQIVALDPTNEYATGVRPLVEDKANFQEQRRYREDFERQLTRQLNAAQEKTIPYDDIYRYPANWPDISQMREKTVKEERGIGQEDLQVQAKLDHKLPEINFANVNFADVIDFLRDITGANIFVNWKALEIEGVGKDTPVTARLREVKFSKALSVILADVGGGTTRLGYTVDQGVITISSSTELNKTGITRVYDVLDIIAEIPDFKAPTNDLLSGGGTNINAGGGNNRRGGGGGGGFGGGGGGGGLFGGGGNNNNNNNTEEDANTKTRQERLDEVIKLIQDTVAPDSWRESGGPIGAIRTTGTGQLIITQTPENHREVQNLLDQLRESRAIMITVETRFLSVQRNFLEDVGVDMDFIFNIKNPDKFSPITVTNNTADFTKFPSTPLPGSIGGTAQGMSVTGTFLDEFQVNFLLRATQAAQTSTVLTAPRVTLFNGQRAYLSVSTVTTYVSDLEPVVAQGAVSYDPIPAQFPSGITLDVTGTVSADRKYVTLTLRPTLTNLIALVPFTFSGNLTNNNNNNGNDGNNNPAPIIIGDNTVATAGTGIIQEPNYQITEVRTSVSVPDGGTLLLGGQTLAAETEREAGVPVLSKIPFLKRLVTNRSFAKDEQVLLILVKPTIIIQREQEQRQFPLLSTKVSG